MEMYFTCREVPTAIGQLPSSRSPTGQFHRQALPALCREGELKCAYLIEHEVSLHHDWKLCFWSIFWSPYKLGSLHMLSFSIMQLHSCFLCVEACFQGSACWSNSPHRIFWAPGTPLQGKKKDNPSLKRAMSLWHVPSFQSCPFILLSLSYSLSLNSFDLSSINASKC